MGNALGEETEYASSSLFRDDRMYATRCREQRRGAYSVTVASAAFPPSRASRALWRAEQPFSSLRARVNRINLEYAMLWLETKT